ACVLPCDVPDANPSLCYGREHRVMLEEWAMAAVLPKLVGDRIKRREDPALIQGLGRYVDDVPMVGTLHAAFFRSPYAHARIKSLNVEAAKRHPGVVTVLTGDDLLGKVGTGRCGAAGPSLEV